MGAARPGGTGSGRDSGTASFGGPGGAGAGRSQRNSATALGGPRALPILRCCEAGPRRYSLGPWSPPARATSPTPGRLGRPATRCFAPCRLEAARGALLCRRCARRDRSVVEGGGLRMARQRRGAAEVGRSENGQPRYRILGLEWLGFMLNSTTARPSGRAPAHRGCWWPGAASRLSSSPCSSSGPRRVNACTSRPWCSSSRGPWATSTTTSSSSPIPGSAGTRAAGVSARFATSSTCTSRAGTGTSRPSTWRIPHHGGSGAAAAVGLLRRGWPGGDGEGWRKRSAGVAFGAATCRRNLRLQA